MLTFRPAALRSCLVALFVFFGLSKAHANITIIHAGKTTVTVQHNGPPTPTPPADFVITNQSGNQITLAWTAAIAPPGRTIARYDVFLNGNKVASTTDSNISLTSDPDGPLLQFFTVQAIDNRGNISPLSAEILVGRANEPLNARIQAKYANTGQNSKDGVTGPTGKSFTAVNYSHEKLADEFTTEGNKIGHRENRLTIAESYNPVVGGWTSVVTGTSDVTRTESYYSLPAVVQHSDWQLLENRAVLVGSSTGSMTLPSVAIPNLPGGVSTATGTTAVVSDSTVLLYNLEGGGYFNVPHGTLTRNETYTLSYANEFTDAMLVTKMLRDYVIAKAGASAVPWPDFDLDVSAFAKNGSLLAASPVNFWDGRPFYYAELVGRRNSQNPVQGSLSTVSGQGSTYRLHTARSGPARFRWIEVFSPYFYGPQGQVTTGPDQSVLREEAVIGGPTGAISREYVVDPPASFGGTSVITLRDGVSVRTPSMSPSPGAPRLYLKNAIFSGEAAQIDFTGVDLGRTTTAIVRATGDAASVRIVAVELSIVADQGMAAALAQGVVIAPGTDLIAESHQILAGGWQLVAVGLTFGTANVTLEITNSGVTYGLGTAITVYPPVGLAVDANRDGAITFDAADATSANAPYRFWLNDDIDRYAADGSYGQLEFDDFDPSDPTTNIVATNGWVEDWRSNQITSLRDLEDFSRMWVNLSGVTDAVRNGQLYVGLRWANTTGDPWIKLYPHVEADGGTKYLFDARTAGVPLAQYSTTNAIFNLRYRETVNHTLVASVSGTFVFPTSVFANLTESSPVAHLLFEGCSVGTGELKLVLLQKNGSDYTEIAQGGSVWFDLKEPKEFIQRWSSGDVDRAVPQLWVRLNANSGTFAPPATDAEKDLVLYVHGYNMTGGASLTGDKQRWIETTYKRLYWLGYKGRVAGYSWPCSIQGGVTDNKGFDDSEMRAWQSGTYLMQLLSSLKIAGYRVHLLAHSQGNVVAGEALLLWKSLGNTTPLVSTYVASQGAIPAHCYDVALPSRTDFTPVSPNVYGHYWTNGDSPTLPGTWSTTNPSYLSTTYTQGAAGTFANFYNPDDYALTGNGLTGSEHPGWMIDQRLKPDVNYAYRAFDTSGSVFTYGPATLRFPDDHYQIFSYAAPAYSRALGSISTGGVFSQNAVDLRASYGFSVEHLWHSGQFRAYNAARWPYWAQLLRVAGIQPITP